MYTKTHEQPRVITDARTHDDMDAFTN